MRLFYRFMLGWSRIDLSIARATGRNPEHVAQLVADCNYWEHKLLVLDINDWEK